MGLLEIPDRIKPEKMYRAFKEEQFPPCREVTLETINDKGESKDETYHIYFYWSSRLGYICNAHTCK